MSDNKVDQIIEGHDYDGVQEFNNAAPFWWQLAFYLSIVFAMGYLAYYLVLGGPSSKQELTDSLAKLKSMQPVPSKESAITEEILEAAVKDPKQLAVGSKIYSEKCLPCHAADGGGLIGPNLTDHYWIHDRGTLLGVYNVIKNGVGDKGMPTWEAQMSPSELIAITGFVKSLRDKPVATAKPPQGEKVD